MSFDFVHSVILLTQTFTFLGNQIRPWGLVFTAGFQFKIMNTGTCDFFKFFVMGLIFIFKPVNPLELVLMQITKQRLDINFFLDVQS